MTPDTAFIQLPVAGESVLHQSVHHKELQIGKVVWRSQNHAVSASSVSSAPLSSSPEDKGLPSSVVAGRPSAGGRRADCSASTLRNCGVAKAAAYPARAVPLQARAALSWRSPDSNWNGLLRPQGGGWFLKQPRGASQNLLASHAGANCGLTTSLNLTRYGRPPWPELRYVVHCLNSGQVVLPTRAG
jgi:hypothetical protein